MLRRTSILRGLLVAGIAFLAPTALPAQSNSPLYWDITGPGLWGTAANWNTDPSGSGGTVGVPVDPVNDAVFSGSLFNGASTIQLGAPNRRWASTSRTRARRRSPAAAQQANR